MENKQIVKKEEKQVTYQVSGKDVTLSSSIVQQFIAKGNKSLTNVEIGNFIQLCKYRSLNPFTNEAYLVKYKDNAQLLVGADAFKRKAEEHPNFEGYRAGIIVMRGKDLVELEGAFKLKTDVLVGGWCETFVKGKKYPIVAKVNFDEYNKGQSTWKDIPCTMIRKVALVQSLREAFPSELGALYSGDELGTEEPTNIQIHQEEANNEIKEKANKVVIDIEVPQEVEEVIVDAEVVEVTNDEPQF